MLVLSKIKSMYIDNWRGMPEVKHCALSDVTGIIMFDQEAEATAGTIRKPKN